MAAVTAALMNPVTAPIAVAIILIKVICTVAGNKLGKMLAEILFGKEKPDESGESKEQEVEGDDDKCASVDSNHDSLVEIIFPDLLEDSVSPLPQQSSSHSFPGYFNSGYGVSITLKIYL